MQSIQYYVKAIYSFLVAGLGSLSVVLAGADMTFGKISDGQWLAALIVGLIAGGGILGWQGRPANISTSIKS